MAKGDARRLVKTDTPGIYKRVGADGSAHGYVCVFRAGGRQRKRTAKTLAEARAIKRASETDADRGEFQPRTSVAFVAFLREWIERYQGTGRRGFREGTRAEYRRLLEQYALAYFGERLRLVDVSPRHLSQFVSWLCDPAQHDGKRLADSTVANAIVPVRAALSTARREGLIRHNPATDLVLPHRERIEEDEDEEVKALSRDQLRLLLAMAPRRYALLLLLIASTGLRISEAIGLQRKHLHLDGSRPRVRVRRAIVKRRVEPPKTRHGKRSVPLAASIVSKLRTHVAGLEDDSPNALVFPSLVGTPLDPDTIRRDWLKGAMEEIGAPGLGFHSLRHTFASLQIAEGVNILQLSRALGHHSAAFTLSTYAHLLEGDEAPPLDVADVLRGNNGGNEASREGADSIASHDPALPVEPA